MPGGIHPPASIVATWPVPNYINPDTRPAVVPPLAIASNIFLVAFSALRLWIRFKLPKTSGLDDVCFAIAVPAIFALTIVIPLATDQHGFNKHVWDNPLATNPTRRKYTLAIITIFSFSSGMLRISILLFYRRLAPRHISPAFRWAVLVTIWMVAMSTLPFSFKPLFACQPISAFWDQFDMEKLHAGYTYRCFDEGADVVAGSAISAVQDLLTALIPNLLLWRLRLKLRQRFMLAALFSLAYCAAAMGFVRLAVNHYIYYRTYDVTWSAWTSMLVTLLELHIAAICACAPALKSFCLFYGIFHNIGDFANAESPQHSVDRQQNDESPFLHLATIPMDTEKTISNVPNTYTPVEKT